MENNGFERVLFDYYDMTPSYVKMVVDMIPESKISNDKKYIIKEIYNFYLNNVASEEKINEVIEVSKMFRERLITTDMQTIALQVNYIYEFFLNKLIFDSFNRDVTLDTMNDNIKLFSGYYEKNNNKIMSESSVLLTTSGLMR